jgi:hypothetical protein
MCVLVACSSIMRYAVHLMQVNRKCSIVSGAHPQAYCTDVAARIQ